jgi:hypothetical protein
MRNALASVLSEEQRLQSALSNVLDRPVVVAPLAAVQSLGSGPAPPHLPLEIP